MDNNLYFKKHYMKNVESVYEKQDTVMESSTYFSKLYKMDITGKETNHLRRIRL